MAPVDPGSLPTLEDRLAPASRPVGWPAGYQEWRRLLFLHWALPPATLRPHVPRSLEIDTYDGQAYLGLVPFYVQAARPVGAPRSLGLAFLETNVRTYVHRAGRDPGVYFFSLDAASFLAVLGARAGLGLPYFYAHGAWAVSGQEVRYRLERVTAGRPAAEVRYVVGEATGPASPATLDHFLVERYLLHVQRGPSLWTVQVHHRPYPLHAARLVDARDALMGADGLPVPTGMPLVHYASGVDVEIFSPRVDLSPGSAC